MPATITNQRRRPPPVGAGHARDHHEPAQAPAPGRRWDKAALGAGGLEKVGRTPVEFE